MEYSCNCNKDTTLTSIVLHRDLHVVKCIFFIKPPWELEAMDIDYFVFDLWAL